MTQDEIIEMARQAGFKMENSAAIQAAEIFHKLATAKEREACVELRNMLHGFDGKGRQEMVDAMNRGLDEYQALIRARGEQA